MSTNRQPRPKMENILEELEQGTVLYKVKSATKLLQRQFFLDSKNMNFYYKGSRRKSRDTKVPVSKISEVREGEKDFSKTLHGVQKELCFGVVISGSHKVMYLMASQQELRDRWVRGLRYVMQMDQLAEQRNEVDKRVREVFNMADKNGDNALDFDEIMKLLKILNANIKKKYVQMMFEKADTNKALGRGHKPVLDRDEFVQFYNLLTRRKEIEEIFLRYSRGKGYMTTRDILVFLKEGQKMPDADEEYCRGLVQHCEPPGPCRSRTQLTIVGFQNFLTSEPQQMFKPEHTRVYQDMSRPITHYFIASSHNTYLAEDQLFGPSKVEMYVRALSDSCRCVELDCWDGPDNEPIIYHGYTRTSKILFKNVIHAIKEYAFKTSPYPVILSLENHCSVEQQSVLARHLENILGDLLWVPDAEITTTPSPKDLMNKIVIKGKKLPPAEEGCYGDEVSDEDEAAEAGSPVDGVVNNNNNNNNNNNVINARDRRKSNAQKKILLSPALSRVTTMKSAGFKNVDQAVALDSPFCVISLSESKVEKLISTQALGLNAVTHTKLIRTYPAGSRTDSSNYNPVPMWNHGCQIVALNYQTGTDPMQLNRGRFLDNGSCGYVLKPNFLLAEEMFGIVNGTVVRNTKKTLRLTIISGMQIPKPQASKKGEVIDPYVKVEIHGAPGDNAEYRTKSIQDNGFNPRWYEACEFKVRVPELAIVRFAVIDEDTGFDDFIGYYTLPFNSMQEGYRHIPILDSSGEPFSHTLLFFHVEISSP